MHQTAQCLLSPLWLFVVLWTVACQAPLSMGFSRHEYLSRLPFPTPGDLSDPGIKPVSPSLAGRFYTTEPPGKHWAKSKDFFSSGWRGAGGGTLHGMWNLGSLTRDWTHTLCSGSMETTAEPPRKSPKARMSFSPSLGKSWPKPWPTQRHESVTVLLSAVNMNWVYTFRLL